MSLLEQFLALVEYLVAAQNGWHDPYTLVLLFALFGVTSFVGDAIVPNMLGAVAPARVLRYLRHWRRRYMQTVGCIRPMRVLDQWLPLPTRLPNHISLKHWTWRDIGVLCCIGFPLLLIDVGILWVGIPWLARQASLPVWVGLAGATVLWATGSASEPMSGRAARGAIIGIVWLAASPDLAVGGLLFMSVVGVICLVCIKATHDLLRGFRRVRRSDWI